MGNRHSKRKLPERPTPSQINLTNRSCGNSQLLTFTHDDELSEPPNSSQINPITRSYGNSQLLTLTHDDELIPITGNCGGTINTIQSEQLILAIERLRTASTDDSSTSIDDIKKLIQLGADVNRPHDGDFPLHLACYCKDTQCLRLLLNNGAEVNKVNDSQQTALHSVANRNGNKKRTWCAEFVDVLIEHGSDINARDRYKSSPLNWAINNYDVDCVKRLLYHGVDVNIRCYNERTPLHCAVESKEFLPVFKPSESDSTLLHWTVECVKLLLQHGADVNAVDASKKTPLHYAVYGNSIDCVKLLLQHGSNVDDLDNNNNTALGCAACFCYIEIIKILLDYGADVSIHEHTPLMRAARQPTTLIVEDPQRVVACVELLIQASGQFHIRDENFNYEIIPELNEIILPYCVSPRSLQVLCRYQIRSSLRNKFLPDVIPSLNLPQRLQSFVLLRR